MKFESLVTVAVGTILAGLFVLGVATLLAMATGCGGASFTEATGEALGALGTDAQTPDAAPPQDALSDAGGYDGSTEADAGPQRVVEPEAAVGCWRTPGARTCPAGPTWLAVTCSAGVADPQAFDSYLECLLVGTGAGTQPSDADDAGMPIFCCADYSLRD